MSGKDILVKNLVGCLGMFCLLLSQVMTLRQGHFGSGGGEVMSPTSEELGQEVGMAPNEGTKLVDPKPKRVRRRPIWAEDYEM